MHRKKILVVAVAGALGMAPAGVAVAAGGAEGNYTIYGKLYPELTSADFNGPTAAGSTVSTLVATPTVTSAQQNNKRPSVDASNSRLGFRGNESLGGGLSAIFQIEQRIRLDTGTAAFWANRDSFVGLAGGFGTVKLGFMDTAYKQVGDQLSFLGISSGNFVTNSNILSRLGFGAGGTGFDFHLRQPNSLVYESPQMAGVGAIVTYSPDEAKGNGGTAKNAELKAVGVKYEAGPVYAALGYEDHKDYFGGSNNVPAGIASPTTGVTVHSKDTAVRATVMLKLGSTTVSVDVAQMEWKETGGAAGRFANYKNTRVALGAEQKFGNITGAVSVVSSPKGTCSLNGGAACSTDGLEARQINLGASYSFSKRTSVFAIFSKLDNGNSASYNNTANATPSVGEDITQFAVGVSHSF